jgi:hypothetical protein
MRVHLYVHVRVDESEGDKRETYIILLGKGSLHTHSNRLLTVVQVAKPTDHFLLVQVVGHNFHAAHGRHHVPVVKHFLLAGRRAVGWRIAAVRLERRLHLGHSQHVHGR